LVFDELIYGQAVMHYSIDDYVTTCTCVSTNDQWAYPAHPLVSSSKTKPCQFGSVTSPCMRFNQNALVGNS